MNSLREANRVRYVFLPLYKSCGSASSLPAIIGYMWFTIVEGAEVQNRVWMPVVSTERVSRRQAWVYQINSILEDRTGEPGDKL